jgi:tRNA modification GTPase
MTALYAAIDYPEEDVGDEGETHIGEVLRTVSGGVKRLLSTYKTGRAVQSGVKCVICGRPNVGKSSLFNRMVGEESAIVTSIAGTTRDVLRETVSFGGVTLRLSDTAGIHTSGDAVEQIGITRAVDEIEGAELILAVWNASEALTEHDRELLERLKNASAPVITVLNKTDLPRGLTDEDEASVAAVSGDVIRVSCETEDGIADLASAVAKIFGSDKLDLRHDAVIWDVRQRMQLMRADTALDSAVAGLTYGDPLDAVCTTVEEAMAALSETDGRGVNEEIVNEIFARFCVGK